VPTAAQQASAELVDAPARAQAKALAINRAAAASALALHADPSGSFVAAERKPERVLDEEEYLDTMSSIIRRDFFPALDAMERKLTVPTPAWNGQLLSTGGGGAAGAGGSRKRARVGRPSNFGEETPMSERPESPGALEPGAPGHAAAAASSAVAAASSSGAAAAAAASESGDAAAASSSVLLRPDELRLGSFLELHTSEDNAAYSEAERKRRKLVEDRRHWANAAFEQKANDTRIVLRDDPKRSGHPSGWAVKVKNRLFFYPEHGGRSELAPDAYDASRTPSQQLADAMAQRSASIEYENTRFPGLITNPFPGQNASSNPKTAAAAAAAAAATPSSAAGSSTPAVGGYKLLRTPVAIPGESGSGVSGAHSPPITWGQVVSTPAHLAHEDSVGAAEERAQALHTQQLALDPAELEAAAAAAAASGDGSGAGGGVGGARFRIAPTPKRDEVAWRMVESARSKDLARKKRRRDDVTPVPLGYAAAAGGGRSSLAAAAAASPRTPLLSPAAQRLMVRTLKVSGGSSSGSRNGNQSRNARAGVDMQLRASYSPAPAAAASAASSRPVGALATGRSVRPPVPLFNATPSPLATRLPSTPAPLR
jgi:hypothetical protein